MNGVAAPALRPRSVPQLLDATVGIARRHAWDFFVLSALFHLPVHAFRIVSAFAVPGSPLVQWFPERQVGSLWWIVWNSLAVSATAVAACQVFTEGATSAQRALEAVRRGGWRLLGTLAALEIVVDGLNQYASAPAMFAFLIFIAYLAALGWCAPAIPAAAVERVAPWGALRRSLWLVRHNFWRVAIVVWVTWATTYLADNESVSLIFSLTHQRAVAAIGDLVVDSVLYPFRGIILAVVYFDCRIRREGYDVEQLMRTT